MHAIDELLDIYTMAREEEIEQDPKDDIEITKEQKVEKDLSRLKAIQRMKSLMARIKEERLMKEWHLRQGTRIPGGSRVQGMAFIYEKCVNCLSKPPHERDKDELNILEPWVRKKSKLFASLQRGTVLDVIKHCEFRTLKKDEPVIVQGEKGYSFYIILKGSVAVLIKETTDDDMEMTKEIDRSMLGVLVSTLGDGAAFGELALLSDDCVRTASIVAEEPTDLVVIHRDLYNRSVARVIEKAYEEKYDFVDSCPVFEEWAQKWKKHLAIAMTKVVYSYEDAIFRQGDKADRLYFILSGEVKLVVDPETQHEQFRDFLEQNINLLRQGRDTLKKINKKDAPQHVQKFLDEHQKQQKPVIPPAWDSQTLTPSLIRRQLLYHRQHSEKVNLCYLGEGQLLGDVEFLLNINKYHATAVCTHETEILWIHKAHFERLFRKRNPSCLKTMANIISALIAGRTNRDGLVHKMPFFKCLQLKLDEMTEDKRKLKEDQGNLPQVNMDNMLIKQRSYSQVEQKLPDPPTRRAARSHTPVPKDFGLKSMSTPSLGATTPILRKTTPAYGAALTSSQSDMVIVDKPLLNPRQGIFVKLMQISNPDASPDHMSVDEEEFSYLMQLRRRIAREFQDMSMGKKVPYSEGIEGIIERPCRKSSRAATQKLAKRMFPMLLSSQPSSGNGGQTHPMSAGAADRRHVRLPNF